MKSIFRKSLLVVAMLSTGCSSGVADLLNPFAQSGPDLGAENLTPLLGDASGGDNEGTRARQALEVMGSYRRAQSPQPVYPVVQPAETRLMWIPDHLNKSGDLVPAHYMHVRVLGDRWAVQDAFELEEQLNVNTPGSSNGATPWVYLGDKKR